MTDPNAIAAQVDAMHQMYCTAADCQLPLTLGRRTCWERLIFEGYGPDDLALVLKRWQTQIRRGMNAGVLRFSRLTDPDSFGEDLVIVHAEQKILNKTSARDRALRELRPQACEPVNGEAAKHAREIALKALEQMRKEIGGN